MVLQYTHLELDKDYPTGIAGYYIPEKEERLKYDGREVLYVIGKAVIEATCCTTAGKWEYALVPGYIINWQKETNEAGRPVSDVEPVLDEQDRGKIIKMIRSSGIDGLVGFW
ncbi:MAG: hypothetical protein PHN78_07620 [Dehalococcoidales bacterium]|nr:hypothetical protein [Dehalococcoidales bacterium]